jgi:hypothetical protein
MTRCSQCGGYYEREHGHRCYKGAGENFTPFYGPKEAERPCEGAAVAAVPAADGSATKGKRGVSTYKYRDPVKRRAQVAAAVRRHRAKGK